jgi:hypothetical protein
MGFGMDSSSKMRIFGDQLLSYLQSCNRNALISGRAEIAR